MFWVLGSTWASEETLPQHVSTALPLPVDLAKGILKNNRQGLSILVRKPPLPPGRVGRGEDPGGRVSGRPLLEANGI